MAQSSSRSSATWGETVLRRWLERLAKSRSWSDRLRPAKTSAAGTSDTGKGNTARVRFCKPAGNAYSVGDGVHRRFRHCECLKRVDARKSLHAKIVCTHRFLHEERGRAALLSPTLAWRLVQRVLMLRHRYRWSRRGSGQVISYLLERLSVAATENRGRVSVENLPAPTKAVEARSHSPAWLGRMERGEASQISSLRHGAAARGTSTTTGLASDLTPRTQMW